MKINKINKNILITLIIFVIIFVLSSFITNIDKVKTIKYVKPIIKDSVKVDSPINTNNKINTDEFSKENLMAYIKELNIPFPRIVMAQAILESGHFKSKLYKNNNNLFGFIRAKKRKTTSIGSKNGYAYYNSWKESVLDYYLYSEAYLSNIKSEEEYLRYLNKHYSQSKNYSVTLKKVMKKIKH
jgi:uncharacterized FlgJ-related protein